MEIREDNIYFNNHQVFKIEQSGAVYVALIMPDIAITGRYLGVKGV